MNYLNLLHQAPTEIKSNLRELETLYQKSIKNKWSMTFNDVCLKENLLPKYTNFRLYDPALRDSRESLEFKRNLIKNEINSKKKISETLKKNQEDLKTKINQLPHDDTFLSEVYGEMNAFLDNSDYVQKTKTLKKLNELYQGQIILKDEINCYINLSDHQLTQNEKQFLNLGLNFHITPRYDKLHKETELEILFDSLLRLQTQNKIDINPRLASLLSAESHKHRNTHKSNPYLTKELRLAAKNLRDNNNIVIRRADKSNIYVTMKKTDYIDKIENILSDSSKFVKISKDPTESVKQQANNLISSLNVVCGDLKLQKVVGEFSPGYIYGTVKTHKNNNPLRPIISQIPTPTYQLAKKINEIILPYLPAKYNLKSTGDFFDLIHSSNNYTGIIASLDVESLFTNVPIDATINIIIKYVYNHPLIKKPKIPQEILRQLLELCTKKSPFRCPKGNIYQQVEGVAMGSPLGPIFANFYMGDLEERIFNDPSNKPIKYARYVDDIYLQANSVDDIRALKQKFEEASVLKFTIELSIENKIPFLDIMVQMNSDSFSTTVYRKPTNMGTCMNGNSDCCDRYKTSVVNNYINRAFNISTSWDDFHKEVTFIKQMLVNNDFSNTLVDKLIN